MRGASLRVAAALAIAAALAACVAADPLDGDGGDDVHNDAHPDAYIPIDGRNECSAPVAPTAEPDWLAAYLRDRVASLAAAPRATLSQRASARNAIAAELEALGYLAGMHPYTTGSNVSALLLATVPSDRMIVLGAHFDSVTNSPGANDNATGVAVVLAAARALANQPCRTAAVWFVFFDQEEVGLLGSEAFARQLRADNVNVVAVHTVDQVGWDADDDLRFEVERPAAGMYERYRDAAAAVGAAVVESSVGGTDHEAFRQEGFDAAGLTEEFVSGDTTPHYHQASDTPATVDAVYHRVAARLVIHLIAREVGASAP